MYDITIRDSKLTTLPESFWSLRLLDVCCESKNMGQLRKLPESFGLLLDGLFLLDLVDTGLSMLPQSLRTLRLRGNDELCALPDSFGDLRSGWSFEGTA